MPEPRRAVDTESRAADPRAADPRAADPRAAERGRPRVSAFEGTRAEAARVAAAALAGTRLAAAVLTRAAGQQPEAGVEEAPVDPWGRRSMPVRYRPLPRRRRRVAGVWILLALVLVAAVGAVPSALRDPAIRATATENSATENSAAQNTENLGGGGGGGPVAPAPAEFTDQLPDGRAQVAIDAALAQLGVPYQWGGNGPAAGDAGFDCSGLTTFAYAAAGISLPRTAHTQYAAGPHVPADAPLQPGDLVFYGSPSAVYHVGMYLGDGKMVNAPNYDQPVQVSHYRWRGDEYLGATRPAATGERRTGLLEYLPQPRTVEGWPRSFDAPRAAAPLERVQPSFALPSESQTAAASVAAAEGTTAQPARSTGTAPAARTSAVWTIPSAQHQAQTAATAPSTVGPMSTVGTVGAVGTDGGVPAPRVTAPGEEAPADAPRVAPPAAAPPALPAALPTARSAVVPADDAPPAGAPAAAEPAASADVPGAAQPAQVLDTVVGTLTLPTGPIPLVAARLGADGVPVVPVPGTAALLDEGGAQLVLLSVAIPLDDSVTVAVDGADPRQRTVVEAQSLTPEQLAEHVRTLPAGEFQVAAPSTDGSWSVAELE